MRPFFQVYVTSRSFWFGENGLIVHGSSKGRDTRRNWIPLLDAIHVACDENQSPQLNRIDDAQTIDDENEEDSA